MLQPSLSRRFNTDENRRFSLTVLETLQDGEVAQIEPEGDETVRTLQNSMKRTAKEEGFKIKAYIQNGILYVKKIE